MSNKTVADNWTYMEILNTLNSRISSCNYQFPDIISKVNSNEQIITNKINEVITQLNAIQDKVKIGSIITSLGSPMMLANYPQQSGISKTYP